MHRAGAAAQRFTQGGAHELRQAPRILLGGVPLGQRRQHRARVHVHEHAHRNGLAPPTLRWSRPRLSIAPGRSSATQPEVRLTAPSLAPRPQPTSLARRAFAFRRHGWVIPRLYITSPSSSSINDIGLTIDELIEVALQSRMPQQSDSELLALRLDAIRSEKADLIKRIEELTADEQRINYALDVIRSVLGNQAQGTGSHRELSLSAHADVRATATGTLTAGSEIQTAAQNLLARPRQRLEDLILNAFDAKDGMTSMEVVAMLELVSGAKRASIMSTLSRMVASKRLRREGKLIFRSTKSEGPEAGTSEPSVFATTSGEGQHTSSAPIGEEGEDL